MEESESILDIFSEKTSEHVYGQGIQAMRVNHMSTNMYKSGHLGTC